MVSPGGAIVSKPAVLAVGNDEVFLIRSISSSLQADAFSIYDITATSSLVGGLPSISMRSEAFYARNLGKDFEMVVTLTDDSQQEIEGKADAIVQAINQTGDPLKSTNPILRFVARSIHAQRTEQPAYVPEIVGKHTRAAVKRSGLGEVIKEFMDEPDWFRSFVRAYETTTPDEDEIFLLTFPDKWILTNQRMYLLGGSEPPVAVRLGDVENYSLRGLFSKKLEIQLTSGKVIFRKGTSCMLEKYFNQYIETLKRHGEI
jgi:hypothetical protein